MPLQGYQFWQRRSIFMNSLIKTFQLSTCYHAKEPTLSAILAPDQKNALEIMKAWKDFSFSGITTIHEILGNHQHNPCEPQEEETIFGKVIDRHFVESFITFLTNYPDGAPSPPYHW